MERQVKGVTDEVLKEHGSLLYQGLLMGQSELKSISDQSLAWMIRCLAITAELIKGW